MARGEPQATVTALVAGILDAEFEATPDWLFRPGELECSNQWPLVKSIYNDLT